MTWVLDNYNAVVGRSYFKLYYFVESDYDWENMTEEERDKWLSEKDKVYSNNSYGYIFKLKFKKSWIEITKEQYDNYVSTGVTRYEVTDLFTINDPEGGQVAQLTIGQNIIYYRYDDTVEDGYLMPGGKTKADIIGKDEWKKARIKNIPLNNCYWYDFKSKDDFINFIKENSIFSEIAEKNSSNYKNNSKFLNIKIKYDNENKLIDYVNFNTIYSLNDKDIKEISMFYEKGFSLQKDGKFINLNSFLKNSEEDSLKQYNVRINELERYEKLKNYKLKDEHFLYQNEAFTNIDENNNKDKLQIISQSGFDNFYKNVTDWLVLENYYMIPYADTERETGCAYKTLLEGKIGSNFGINIWWDGLLQTVSLSGDIVKIFGPISYWMIQARGGDPFIWNGSNYVSNGSWKVKNGDFMGSWHAGGSGASDLMLINFEKGDFIRVYIYDATGTYARSICVNVYKTSHLDDSGTTIAYIQQGSDGSIESTDEQGNIIYNSNGRGYGKKGSFKLLKDVAGIQHFPCNGLDGYCILGSVNGEKIEYIYGNNGIVNWNNYFNGKQEIKTETNSNTGIIYWGERQRGENDANMNQFRIRSTPSLNSGVSTAPASTWAIGRGAGGGGWCTVDSGYLNYTNEQTYSNSEPIKEAVWLLDAKR